MPFVLAVHVGTYPVFENNSLYLITFKFFFCFLHSLDVLRINCRTLPSGWRQMELTNLFS